MSAPDCPFCKLAAQPLLVSELAWACFDKNPVTPGHVLLITCRHVEDWFAASAQEQRALIELAGQARELLEVNFHPQGYNLGANIGVVAGQTIPHLHLHLIPRYSGDCSNPRGGVRGVIPGKQSYPAQGDPS